MQKKKSTVLPADVETWPLSAMVQLGDVFVASVATCTDTGLLLSPNLELREQRFSAHLWSFHPAFVSSQLFPHKPSLTPSLSSCPSHSSPLFNTAPVSCFLLLEEAPCSPGPCIPQPCSPSHNNVTAQCPDPQSPPPLWPEGSSYPGIPLPREDFSELGLLCRDGTGRTRTFRRQNRPECTDSLLPHGCAWRPSCGSSQCCSIAGSA